MAELELARDLRLELKARAHHLDPVVLLGAQGLSEAVLKEIERALVAHELIKVRLPLEDRDHRDQLFAQMAQHLNAARIVHIGKLVVLYRPRPADEAPDSPAAYRDAGKQGTRDARRAGAPRTTRDSRTRENQQRDGRPGRRASSEAARPPRVARGRGR